MLLCTVNGEIRKKDNWGVNAKNCSSVNIREVASFWIKSDKRSNTLLQATLITVGRRRRGRTDTYHCFKEENTGLKLLLGKSMFSFCFQFFFILTRSAPAVHGIRHLPNQICIGLTNLIFLLYDTVIEPEIEEIFSKHCLSEKLTANFCKRSPSLSCIPHANGTQRCKKSQLIA